MKKFFKNLINVYNDGDYKVFKFLFIRAKVKNKHKILLNAITQQQNHITVLNGKLSSLDKNMTDLKNQYALQKEIFANLNNLITAKSKMTEEQLRALKADILNIDNFASCDYWEDRYAQGGNSGAGSYGNLAEFKAKVINDFVIKHKIKSVIDFGCGDGNQLSLSKYDKYTGFDVSKTAIDICKQKFTEDKTKDFRLMQNYNNEKAELTLSLDVIFHLLEDSVFDNYMKTLFNAGEKFVIIYSSNKRGPKWVKHVKHRKFTDWTDKNASGWKLLEFIPNPHHTEGTGDTPDKSFSDFYIFGKH